MEQYDKMLEDQDQKRAAQWALREEKLKKKYDMMGQVYRKHNREEKERDKQMVDDIMNRDREAELLEQKNKQLAIKKRVDLNKYLDAQVSHKNQLKKKEKQDNEKFIKMVIDQDE